MKYQIPETSFLRSYGNPYAAYAEGYAEGYTAQVQAAYEAGRAAGLEEAAKVCDTYAEDKWALYKGRAPYDGTEEGRASPDTQGHSDGASECADAIRNLKETPCA